MFSPVLIKRAFTFFFFFFAFTFLSNIERIFSCSLLSRAHFPRGELVGRQTGSPTATKKHNVKEETIYKGTRKVNCEGKDFIRLTTTAAAKTI